MRPISRREFGAALAAGAIGGRFALPHSLFAAAPPALTAEQVIARIRENVGVPWRAETVDTIKAGDPSTVITGVVTTALATLSVLQQAKDAGANLVISTQPPFYGRADSRTPPRRGGPGGPAAPGANASAQPEAPPPADPVYDAKNAFIDQNRLVIFRFSDHWRARQPSPLAQGLGEMLGGAEYQVPGDPTRYEIPGITLRELAGIVKERLGSRGGIRVVGNPETTVRRVALLPGSTPITAMLETLPGVDAVIAGEVREWESVEYARDVVDSGQGKGLILIGRIVSEEPGMALCARWLSSFLPEVPVRHIAAGDPYWRPVS